MKIRHIIWIFLISATVLSNIRTCIRNGAAREIRVDTLIVRDTIRDTIPLERTVERLRTDTVWLKQPGDTVYVEVEIPIERKTYITDTYRAVIEGYKPKLCEIETYSNSVHITESAPRTRSRHRRWGAGIQAGYGITSTGLQPYIGIGIQYNLITW